MKSAPTEMLSELSRVFGQSYLVEEATNICAER